MWRKLISLVYFPYRWLFVIPFMILNSLFFGIVAVVVSTLINTKWGSFFGGVLWARLNALATPMIVNVKGKENI